MTLQQLDLSTLSRDRANQMWEHISNGLIDDFHRNNPELVAARLLDPHTVAFEHDSGLVTLSSICPNLGAEIHFWTWEKVSDAELIRFGREVVSYAFDTYNLERLTAWFPAFNGVARRVSLRLGFRYEGLMRHAFLYKGKYFDVEMTGMTRRDYQAKRAN